ncbi:MAG: hypothetical protein R3F13_13170 [Prosthecobacter sp.]
MNFDVETVLDHEACVRLIRDVDPHWLEEIPGMANMSPAGKTCVVHQTAYNPGNSTGLIAVFVGSGSDPYDNGWVVFLVRGIANRAMWKIASQQLIQTLNQLINSRGAL